MRNVIQGDLFASRGDQVAAIRSYTSALSRQGRDPDVYFKRGLSYAQSAAEIDKAVADFNQALILAPNRADVLAARGAARLVHNDSRGALADLDAAIALDAKKRKRTTAVRAPAWRAATRKAPSTITRRRFGWRPSLANAYLGRAGIYENAGKIDAAIADLQQVVKLSTDPLDLRAAQARLTRLGSPPAAKEPATVFVQFQTLADSPVADDLSTVLSQRGIPGRQAPTRAAEGCDDQR